MLEMIYFVVQFVMKKKTTAFLAASRQVTATSATALNEAYRPVTTTQS